MTVREADIETLYLTFLDHWNKRDAAGMAGLCAPHAYVIGFDGSELDGRDAIEAELQRVFAHHATASYVARIRSVEIFAEVAILHAVVGMVPPGAADLDPELNAIQTFIVSRDGTRWHVEVLQNTPAAFHGRPEARERLTAELREALRTAPPSSSGPGE